MPCRNKLARLSVSHFHPGLIFTGKAEAYPNSGFHSDGAFLAEPASIRLGLKRENALAYSGQFYSGCPALHRYDPIFPNRDGLVDFSKLFHLSPIGTLS